MGFNRFFPNYLFRLHDQEKLLIFAPQTKTMLYEERQECIRSGQ